jgi:hypothetical protein
VIIDPLLFFLPQQWVPFVPLAEQDGEDQLNGDDDVSRALHSSSVVELFVSLTECRKFMNRIKRYIGTIRTTAHAPPLIC